MLLEMKVLIITVTLISYGLSTIADILVQPGYNKGPTQHSPIHPQSSVKSTQQQRESEFGHTQTQLIPVYTNGYQGGIPYQVEHPLLGYPHYLHYPHYPHYPQYVHAWPRHAPQRHLRVLKIGGHKVVHPSWYVGQPSIPMTVHRRYKKSIEGQSNAQLSRKTIHGSKDSSLVDVPLDTQENENNVFSQQSKNDHASSRGFLDMSVERFMNPENPQNKLKTQNERNTKEYDTLPTNEPSESNGEKTNSLISEELDSPGHKLSSQIPQNEPSLGNFPDPRPSEDQPTQKTTLKPILKNSSQEKPLLGTPLTQDGILKWQYVQHEYPTPSAYNYYYNLPPYENYAPPPVSYLPVYTIRYDPCNDDTSKTYDNQQLGNQELMYQAGAIGTMHYPLNTEYALSPQTYYYLSNYALGYPVISHYTISPYQIPCL